jgi:hypothetical protein
VPIGPAIISQDLRASISEKWPENCGKFGSRGSGHCATRLLYFGTELYKIIPATGQRLEENARWVKTQ